MGDKFLDEIIQLKIKLRDIYLQHYFERELFSLNWWIELALLIFPLILWWKIVDKKRLLEICVFGLLVNMIATFLDVAGSDYVFWIYPVQPLPQIPLMIPVDYVIVPVVGMIIYQKFPKWSKFIYVSIIASLIMSFICEPLAVYIGIYELITWEYIYSFPIYILVYAIAKFITERFCANELGIRKL